MSHDVQPLDEPMDQIDVRVNPMGDLIVHATELRATEDMRGYTEQIQYGTFYEDSRVFTPDPVQGFGPGYLIEERHDY